MKFRSLIWIIFGLLITSLALLAAWQPSQAQSGGSACISCHETQAQKPVRAAGQWHIQHNTLACEICHGGNPAAPSQAEAHAGQITDPLAAGMACSLCHPEDSQEKIAAYLALVTPEAADPQSPTVTAEATEPQSTAATAEATEPQSTAAPLADGCRIIATACAESTAPALEPSPAITATQTSRATATAPLPGSGSTTDSGSTAGSAGGTGSGFSWLKMLQFTRGPLFKAAFWFFVIGMLLRLIQTLHAGWKHRTAIDKTGRAAGVGKSFASGLLVLPFIPGLKGAFQRKPVIYLAGGLFHLGLLTVILLSKTHMSAWKGVIGLGWPVLPGAAVSWLAAIGLVAMLALLINRLVDPVLRLISGPAEWMNWLLVFLPMATGFVLARKLWLPYEVSFSIHMLLVDILLIWIPLSRISHFTFYFFARAIHGVEFQTRRVVNP
jgi:nitrate reductase gamma subunit